MERTWLETIQLLGLDLQLAWVALMLAGAWLSDLTMRLARHLGAWFERARRAAPRRSLDGSPAWQWGARH